MYATGNVKEILESTVELLVFWRFDLLEIFWHQPQTTTLNLMHFSRAVLEMNNAIWNVRN